MRRGGGGKERGRVGRRGVGQGTLKILEMFCQILFGIPRIRHSHLRQPAHSLSSARKDRTKAACGIKGSGHTKQYRCTRTESVM
jgi:hypothetical protein